MSAAHISLFRLARRLHRLLSLLIIYSLIAGSFPSLAAASRPAAPTGAARQPARLTSARTELYLPIIRAGGTSAAPTPTTIPTATPSATAPATTTPTSTPSATAPVSATPSATPSATAPVSATPSATAPAAATETPGDASATPTSTPDETDRDNEPPSAPANLRLDTKTDTAIGLIWDAVTDNIAVTGYQIEIGGAFAAAAADTQGIAGDLRPDTSYSFTVRAKDAAGNLSEPSAPFRVRTKRADGLPYDPAAIAPPINRTVAGDFAADTEFLYTGPDAIQTGIVPGTIDARRAAVLRGLVQTREGAPLPGATIAVLGHPEYGQTQSRADGVFDLAVNGGGQLTVSYAKDGYLPAQRQIQAPLRDFAWLPDAALVPLDGAVTEVTLDGASPAQLARGSAVSDGDGTRQATLLFPENTSAEMVLADNTTVPLGTLHIRATEYTVGPNGPKAMPGALPPNSAYTYAAEFSADEAIAAGAKSVRLSQPAINYVENFLDFPVGLAVPTGYYDRDRAAWVPSKNGRVIKIVGATDGMADLDITGDDIADDASALGVSAAERRQLAELYPAGQELWRVPIPHFTPWDHNFPYRRPRKAIGPNGGPPRGDDPLDDPCLRGGSIIECQNQTLGEAIPVSGTPFRLHYQSDRVAGRTAANTLDIPISGASLPDILEQIDLTITVAGQRITQTFEASSARPSSQGSAAGGRSIMSAEIVPNLDYSFTWDGQDAYGRDVQGAEIVGVDLGYVYPTSYAEPAGGAESFGMAGGAEIVSLDRTGAEATIAQISHTSIGPFDAREQGLGGWTLDVQHTYDPTGRTLYLGDGSRRSAESRDSAIEVFAGFCTTDSFNGGGYYGDGGPADDAVLNRPAGLAFGPDGSLYIADRDNQRVRRVDPNGVITSVAGTGDAGFGGDGGPATAAQLSRPSGVAAGPDGALYIADTNNNRIRRIGLDGAITTVAGGASPGFSGDGGPATQSRLRGPTGVAVGPDGALYIADVGNSRVRRVSTSGIISTVAGNGSRTASGNGGYAKNAGIGDPTGIALGADGSLYIVDNYNMLVRRVTVEGLISTFAGGGSATSYGDGGPATLGRLYFPYGAAVGPDNSLYIADQFANRIRVVRPDGVIATIAGNGNLAPIGESGPAAAAGLAHPRAVAVAPNGSVYAADTDHHCVRQVDAQLPGFTNNDIAIPSSDGRQLYQFDYAGRHLRTLDALTGDQIYAFAYDEAGRLAQVADRDGRATQIQRDSSGAPLAIVGLDGQRTSLAVNSEGHLTSITNPAGETTLFDYTPDGLLTALTDPRGGTHTFAYNEKGRLARDTNPAGGFTELSRSDDRATYVVTNTNALGDSTIMRVESLPTGDQLRVDTAPSGAATTTLIKADGTRVITDTRGSVTTSVQGPDPRWGMQAPFVKSLKITSADGRTYYSLSADRTVALSDASNPFSIQSQTDTVTINGRTTTTVFDVAARTLTTTDPAGKRTVTTLDARGHPLREETTNLAPRQYSYDQQGRLTSIVEGDGADARASTLSYNAQGYLAATTDALGGTTSYTYDMAGRLLSQTLPTGHAARFTYDAAGNRTSSTDQQGLRTTYEYDSNNRLVASTIDPAGRAVRTEFSYDLADNLLARVEDAGAGRLNATTQYEYIPIGGGDYAPSRVADPLGHATLYAYTPSGEVSRVIDPLGHTTILTYTAQGWRSAVTTPGGRTTLTTYTDDAQAASVTDPRGSRTTFGYDAAGRLKTVTAGTQAIGDQPAINQTLTYDYDANGRVIRVTDPRAKATTRAYDSFGRLSEERDPLGNTVTLSYDALDRLVLQTSGAPGAARATAYDYDAAGRLLAARADPGGLNLATEYRYSSPSAGDSWSPLETVDPQGHVTAYHYDSLGLRDTVTDALGQTWRFAYDNLGRQIGQTDPLGHTTGSTFDALGHPTSLTEDGRTERWSYNADGTLAAFADFMGRATRFSYDADQRMTGVDYPAGTADVGYTYDAAGNLVAMADGLGTTAYRYDALNRLRSRARGGRTVTYDYTADDQVARIDYWGRGAAAYVYDDAGRLASLTPWGASPTSYTYGADGTLASQTRGNGVATDYGYDSAGRLAELLHRRGAAALNDIRYALDRNGNRTRLDDADGTTSFGYDALDRLAEASYPGIPGGPAAATSSYSLDPTGNRLSDGATSYAYDASGRIASPGYSYDANGNLLADGAATYAYDAANRLIQSVRGGVTTAYGYDGNGNLVRETVNGVTTDFVLDERGALPRILGEVRSDGSETLYAYGPDGFAAQQSYSGGAPQGLQYPLLDALGSVRQLADSAGAIVLSRSYDAFGALRYTSGAAKSRMGFTGEPTGLADGTIYLRARHYSPALGRFLQRDTFAGFTARPQSLNRYAYAENNPATLTDPSGHCPFCVAVAGGALIGAAVEYGSQVYNNYQSGKSGWDAWTDVQGDKIGQAALQGAIAGGVGFVAGPLVGALSKSGLLGSVVGGALEGMAGNTLGQIAVNLLKGCAWDSKLLQALLSGGVAGALGGGLGWGARKIKDLASFGSGRLPRTMAWHESIGEKLRVYNDRPTPRLRFTVKGSTDDAMELAKQVRPLEGFLDVFVHSNGKIFAASSRSGEPMEVPFDVVAEVIEASNPEGLNIRLVSCYAGMGEDSLAQRLATRLNRDVLAADNLIFPDKKGGLDIVTNEDLSGGIWKLFSP